MPRVILFNKPYQVLCQFTDSSGRYTLADYIKVPSIYAAGRLDFDSEGLVLLTDSGKLQYMITDPQNKLEKTYWVQIEGTPSEEPLLQLQKGLILRDGLTAPLKARLITEPVLWKREPPIRYRINVPTSWLEIKLTEGRKRQIRRMTAAIGYPTLRLVRIAIGNWRLGTLMPGEWRDAERS
jgi:23S rRNA pseudouridine2457 synthase